MGRYSARNASSPEDSRIQEGLNKARREIDDAIRTARSVRSPRSDEAQRALRRVLAAMDSVGTLIPRRSDDPDMIPESERAESYRQRMVRVRDEKRNLRNAERRATRKAVRAAGGEQ